MGHPVAVQRLERSLGACATDAERKRGRSARISYRRTMHPGHLAIVAAVMVAGCSAGHVVTSASARSAAAHATTAGMVMSQDPAERSANDAAWLVVGQNGDTTIEALEATGTTYDGTVVLRITVQGSGTFADDTATRCYSYHLVHRIGASTPTALTCPPVQPVRLTSPAAKPDLTTAAEMSRFHRVLADVRPSGATYAARVVAALTAAFPPPLVVSAAYIQRGVLQAAVRSSATCLVGYVSATRQITISAGSASRCQS